MLKTVELCGNSRNNQSPNQTNATNLSPPKGTSSIHSGFSLKFLDRDTGGFLNKQLRGNQMYFFHSRKAFANTLVMIPLLFVSSVSTTGCLLLVGAGAGAGGAAYVMGKLDAELDGTVSRVHHAAVAGMKDLSMPLNKNQVDKLSAKIESKTADDKPVWIDVDYVTDSRSKVSIRAGYIGDEVRSRKILDSIRKHL